MKSWLLIAGAAASIACSGAPPLAELEQAEKRERAGDDQAALRAYLAAQSTCRRIDDPLRRRAACADAHLGRAELLVDMARERDAVVAFERAAVVLTDDEAARARATLRAGQLHLDLGHDALAYQHLWRVVTDYPEQAFAADALVLLVRDGRRRDASQLYQVLVELYERQAGTEIGDNLLFALAQLAEEERGDARLALSFYDTVAARYRKSGLRDDSLWRGARLARKLANPAGAERRLRLLLDTREVAWGAGSYFSVWLDDAQLELGRVLRDDLGRKQAALDEFARLPRDYPASILRDDALWERALTFEQIGDAGRACASLAELARHHPESRWELEQAPSRRRKLGCPGRSPG
ncbi:MAG TPA: tetratricopeptide repeat protein, partial [Kofleriaceae bacterium]|nr:tetratricopeptide repeat protein [Kofleriaceae bacterium]